MAQRSWPLGTWAMALALATGAAAVSPENWDQTSYSDFRNGEVEQTVVSSLGEIRLAAATETLGELPPLSSVVYDLQPLPDGKLYVAVGPQSKLLVREAGKLREILSLHDEQIFSLDVLQGKLLVGISGPVSRLAVLEGQELRTLVNLDAASLKAPSTPRAQPSADPDAPPAGPAETDDESAPSQPAAVRYIWDMAVHDRAIYLATGTPGRLLQVDTSSKQPTVRVLLETQQNNLLCLGRDGQGRLYAGSDTDGLIYRVHADKRGQATAYVLYDAAEPEIGALLVLADGTVYAGTADADQAKTQAEGADRDDEQTSQGKPTSPAGQDQPSSDEPIPDELGQEDDAPFPPDAEPAVPDPTPADDGDASPDGYRPSQAPPEVDRPALAALSTAPDTDAAATARQDQLDQLRAEIRRRLEVARRTGVIASASSSATRPSPSRDRGLLSAGGKIAKAQTATAAAEEGNAIYRIDPQGFVTEVFREAVMVLRLLADPLVQGAVLAATGNEGKVYRVGPQTGEYAVLADLKVDQVPAMVMSHGQRPAAVLLGTAHPAALLRLSDRFAREGQFVSEVHDARQVSLWGAIQVVGRTPAGTALVVQTRSGNVADPQLGHWSAWTDAKGRDSKDSGDLGPRWLQVQSPPGRFFQYRLALTGDGSATPMVDRVLTTYITPNLRPKITTLSTSYGEPKGGQAKENDKQEPANPILTVEWEASDGNDDALRYTLEYQGDGWDVWLPLAADLQDSSYEWDTRQAPDGWYLLRLTASDQAANPPGMDLEARRLSEPLLIDNTPPLFEHGPLAEVKDKQVVVSARVADALSAIKAMDYAVDSTEQWRGLLPEDLLADSTQEDFRVSITGLPAGAHVITLRVSDSHGNRAYRSVQVRIPSKDQR